MRTRVYAALCETCGIIRNHTAFVQSTVRVLLAPEIVLFVRVSVPASVAISPSVMAVLNCATVPVIPTIEVWSPVFVPEFVPVISEVNARVPLASLRV